MTPVPAATEASASSAVHWKCICTVVVKCETFFSRKRVQAGELIVMGASILLQAQCHSIWQFKSMNSSEGNVKHCVQLWCHCCNGIYVWVMHKEMPRQRNKLLLNGSITRVVHLTVSINPENHHSHFLQWQWTMMITIMIMLHSYRII